MANTWKRFFLWVAGWQLVKPVQPEPQSIKIDPDARYLCLVDARWVAVSQARSIHQLLPRGSVVHMIECSGDQTPLDVVQLFKVNP